MKIPTKMKAMVAQGYGAPQVYELQEVETPAVKPGTMLVKIEASAATRADAMMRTGKPYFGRLMLGLSRPKHPIPGTCFAGVVVELGEGVSLFSEGDRVLGLTTLNFSANADYLLISAEDVVLAMPEQLSFAEAAPLGDGALTSLNFLKNVGRLKPGQKVLINGASGALGASAIQLAKYMGAHVTGVCSSRNVGLVRSLGADEVIDYTKEDFLSSDQEFDLIFDTIGKSSYSKAKSVLAPKGVYMSPVLGFSLLVTMLFTAAFSTRKAVFAATGLSKVEQLRMLYADLLAIIREGKHQTIIDRQFPLEKLVEAHTYIDAGHKKGNVVITHANA